MAAARGGNGNLTSTTLTGLGMGGQGSITYSGLAALNLIVGGGGTTFTIQSDNPGTVTTLNIISGNDTINVESTSSLATYIFTPSGSDVINIGSPTAPPAGSIVTGIQGPVIFVGDGSDTMNVQDTGSTTANTGTLSTTSAGQGLLTGLGMGSMGVTFSNLGALNISLGNGNNTFNILSTQAGTTTTLNDGSGHSTVNVGSLAPATGGNVNGIQGALIVNDDNHGTLNVDDTGSMAANTGTLTNTTLTGLGMAGITYNNLAALNISLGSGGNIFNITSTSQNTATTLYVQQGSGDVINVGSLAPQWNGQLNTIQGPLTVVGNGSDIMNVEDGGGLGFNGDVTSTALTGFGMGKQGVITYSGLSNLNLSVDDGSLTVASTHTGTVTTIDVQVPAGQTNITTVTGTDVINIGSLAPATGGTLTGIQAPVMVVSDAGTNTTVNVDDSGSPATNTGTLTNNTLTGLDMQRQGQITYSGLAALNLTLGSGPNTLTVASTQPGTATSINVERTSGSGTTITTRSGIDTINIGSLAPATGGNLNNIRAPVTVLGDGSTTMNVDDTGSNGPEAGTLTSTTLSGLGMEDRAVLLTAGWLR